MNARDVIDAVIYFENDNMGMSNETTIGETFGADAILSALDAAGFVVVPKEPTDRMIIRFMEETESDAYELAIAMYKAMPTAAEGEP